MPTGTLRIAVCQLECHPSLAVGGLDYLGEPILPEPGTPSLSTLSRYSLDVADLQKECARRYEEWHRHGEPTMIEVLGFLESGSVLGLAGGLSCQGGECHRTRAAQLGKEKKWQTY